VYAWQMLSGLASRVTASLTHTLQGTD